MDFCLADMSPKISHVENDLSMQMWKGLWMNEFAAYIEMSTSRTNTELQGDNLTNKENE